MDEEEGSLILLEKFGSLLGLVRAYNPEHAQNISVFGHDAVRLPSEVAAALSHSFRKVRVIGLVALDASSPGQLFKLTFINVGGILEHLLLLGIHSLDLSVLIIIAGHSLNLGTMLLLISEEFHVAYLFPFNILSA